MPFRFGTRQSLGLPIGGGAAILKPQDVFTTSLYTGNGGTQTVTNGLDLAGKGGVSWLKRRDTTGVNALVDSVRGPSKYLLSNTTDAEDTSSIITSFNTNGISLGATGLNNSGGSYAAWSFARAAKFFDIVTWTGDGTSNRQIPHGLGVVPGMIVIKSRSATGNWPVWHRSTGDGNYMLLDTTQASSAFPHVSATSSTTFTLGAGNHANSNASGVTYVAYLFAHDPSADGIVQCGASTADGAGTFTIPHGWAGGAQWLIYKRIDAVGGWFIADTARSGANFGSNSDPFLLANSSNAEFGVDQLSQSSGVLTVANGNPNAQFVWAIIRAPY